VKIIAVYYENLVKHVTDCVRKMSMFLMLKQAVFIFTSEL
jgi:hypothetical protein